MEKDLFVDLAKVAEITGGSLVGDGARSVSGVCAPTSAAPDKICVVWEKRLLDIVPHDVPVLCRSGWLEGRDGVEHPSPRAALADVLALFDARRYPDVGIHSTASIGSSCSIAPDVRIGPHCVVESGAKIGAGSILFAGVYVGFGVSVGEGCVVEPGVVLMEGTSIGSRARLHGGVKIGSDGFGFEPTAPAQWKKIPQIGRIIIGDDVEVGANATIDRATFGSTIVGDGTKIGSMVHIAHNCEIGRGVVIVGFSAIGGSCSIGDGAVVSGMVAISDHVRVGRGATVAGRSGVTKDVPDGTTVSGYPAQEHRKETRLAATLRSAPEKFDELKRMKSEIEDLRRAIDELRGRS